MPRLKAANNAYSTLSAAITAAATELYVASAAVFPDAPFIVVIDDEIIEVGAIDRPANRLYNLLRGREGTTAAAHSAGVLVENRWTAGTHGELADQAYVDNAISSHTAAADPHPQYLQEAIPDTRSTAINPGDIQKSVRVDFKTGSTIGLTGSFYTVWTMRGWFDDSGGPAWQVALGSDGLWARSGTQAGGWGGWFQIAPEVKTNKWKTSGDYIIYNNSRTAFRVVADKLIINDSGQFSNGTTIGASVEIYNNGDVYIGGQLQAKTRVNAGKLEFWDGTQWKWAGST